MQTTNLDFSRDESEVHMTEHRALRDSQLSIEDASFVQEYQRQEPDDEAVEQPDMIQGYIVE